jgi:hypothetical protein
MKSILLSSKKCDSENIFKHHRITYKTIQLNKTKLNDYLM